METIHRSEVPPHDDLSMTDMSTLTDIQHTERDELVNLMDTKYAQATNEHASSAMKKFAQFIREYTNDEVEVSALTAAHVNEDMMGKFASFLVADSTIGLSSSTTYLSSVKRQLVDQTRTTFFIERNDWYKSLRSALRNKYLQKAVDDGRPLQDKAPLMTMQDLCVICESLFLKGETTAIKDRTLLSFQWSLVGRSSDVGDALFSHLKWCEKYLLMQVLRKKTRQEHSVAVFPSAFLWQIDPIHSLAAQLAVGRFSLSDRLFSQIAFETSQQNNTAAYINRLLENVTKSSDPSDLTPGLRSHSSRRGAAAVAAASSDINLSDLAHRGRWQLDNLSTVLEYISPTCSSDHKVARVLGGWENPARDIHPATLSTSDPPALDQRAFARNLFLHYRERLGISALIDALAASLLLYFDQTFGVMATHKEHEVMIESVQMSNESLSREAAIAQLGVWGRDIKQRFVRSNLNSIPLDHAEDSDTVIDLPVKFPLSDTITRLSIAQRDIASEVSGLSSRLSSQAAVQEELLSLQKQVLTHQKDMMQQQARQAALLEELLNQSYGATPRQSTVRRQATQEQETETAQSAIHSEATISEPPLDRPLVLPAELPRTWPNDMCSLRGWKLADLVYRVWLDRLLEVPCDYQHHAQRDARQAALLATSVLGERAPAPFPLDGSSSEKEAWMRNAQALARVAQTEINVVCDLFELSFVTEFDV